MITLNNQYIDQYTTSQLLLDVKASVRCLKVLEFNKEFKYDITDCFKSLPPGTVPLASVRSVR